MNLLKFDTLTHISMTQIVDLLERIEVYSLHSQVICAHKNVIRY